MLLVFGLFLGGNSAGQKRAELEKKRIKTQAEIEYSSKLLEETEESKKQTVAKLELINYQIDRRKFLISDLNEEVSELEASTQEYEKLINSLAEDLEVIRQEYIKILRYTTVIGKKRDLLMFILASNSVYQAFNRMMYVKKYASYRSNQINLINKTLLEIEEKRAELERTRIQKSITLSQKENEAERLKIEMKTKGKIVQNLRSKERELKRSIQDKQRIAAELQILISKAIEEERKKLNSKKDLVLTPEEKIIAGDFQKNRGRLPWPTEKGIITSRYGKQEHPLIKNTFIQNNGVDITTESGGIVRALFDGIVTKVVSILGANYTVIIKHGSFYSVYQNLVDVKVTKGEAVKTMQRIGKVDDGRNERSSTLHLEIWQNFDRMNPEEWLAK